MKLTAIFASTESGAFGLKGDLPWGRAAPQDLKLFKSLTTGGVLIMGHNTYQGVAHLKDRDKVVISRGSGLATISGTFFVETMEEALEEVDLLGYTEAFLIGGAGTLQEHAHLADSVVWSLIPGDYPADTFLDVEKILNNRNLMVRTTLTDGTKVHQYGEIIHWSDQRSALEEALDREQKTTFGNIPIKENLEYKPTEAKDDVLEITKKMLRGH